jgi:hydrogenase maturation protease
VGYARVIGLGQPAAGDDGVGLEVVTHLRRRGLPAGVELLTVPEPSALIPLLLAGTAAVVLVDAVLAEPPGRVLDLTVEALARRAPRPVSSHGLDLGGAVELARALGGGEVSGRIMVVAVSIARPRRLCFDLSPEVAAAVPVAAARVLEVVARGRSTPASLARSPGSRSG